MPHTLLLADDSVTIQRVIELTFAGEDIDVIAVGDGDGAIEAASRRTPDIVLADIAMPGRSGYDVARHFRQTPELSRIPVLLLAGAFEPVDEARVRDVGAQGVLAKPFEPQAVVRRVRELLASATTTSDVAPPRPPDAVLKPVATPVAGEPAAPPVSSPPHAELDDYFERLDQAFAARANQPPPPVPVVAASADDQVQDRAPEGDAPERSALAGAFSALLAAERSADDPRRAQIPPPEPPRVEISDALVERVARLVIERMTDRVIRDTVAEITTATAERLVVEEIERIKSVIK